MNPCRLLLSASLLLLGSGLSGAELRESYVARLSARDHFNSAGVRLTTAEQIVRQDRANHYKLAEGDPEDQDDRFFRDAKNREILQAMLARGTTSDKVYRAIVDGEPLVRVSVYCSKDHCFVNLELVAE